MYADNQVKEPRALQSFWKDWGRQSIEGFDLRNFKHYFGVLDVDTKDIEMLVIGNIELSLLPIDE
jgi:hypothetical protein